MSNLFKRIDTVFLPVKNFEKAIDWYCEVLGFSLRWKDEKNGYAALNIGETPLTLVRETGKEDQNVKSHITFNFFTPDAVEAHKHLVECGVTVEPIQDEGSVKWFKFYDLEGNALEVCHFQE